MSTFKGIDTIEDLKRFCPNAEIPAAPVAKDRHQAVELVSPGVAIVQGRLVVYVPIKTASEINGRDWKGRSRRSSEGWRAVSRTLGPHLDLLAPYAMAYHDQKALGVTFTRLGGRRMDHSNLPTATKAVEDALAFMMGADDGDPRFHSSWSQDTAHKGVGILIEVEILQ